MLISRNKQLIAAIAVPAILVAIAQVVGATEKPRTEYPAETRQPQQKGAKAPVRNPSKGVFKPKQKVSAGKPVSFPSDI
jgi:hypothetical protein